MRKSGKAAQLRVMRMWPGKRRRLIPSAVCLTALLASGPARGGDDLVIERISLDRPTLHVLGVQLLIQGDDDRDAAISIRYRERGTVSQRDGPPLFRVLPSTVSGFESKPQFAGSIFDLLPGTTYEIELHAVDPDGLDWTRILVAATRPVPAEAPLHPASVTARSGSELRELLSSAGPGTVVSIVDGVYEGTYSIPGSGTAVDPILVRGESRTGTTFDGGGCADCSVVEVHGSHVHVENLSVRNAAVAIRLFGRTGNVVRRVHISDVTHGISSGGRDDQEQTDFYIADNVIEGRLSWPWPFDEDARSHWDDRGVWVFGDGHVVCHNRIRGFGDPLIQRRKGGAGLRLLRQRYLR